MLTNLTSASLSTSGSWSPSSRRSTATALSSVAPLWSVAATATRRRPANAASDAPSLNFEELWRNAPRWWRSTVRGGALTPSTSSRSSQTLPPVTSAAATAHSRARSHSPRTGVAATTKTGPSPSSEQPNCANAAAAKRPVKTRWLSTSPDRAFAKAMASTPRASSTLKR